MKQTVFLAEATAVGKGSICNFLPIRIKPEPDSGLNPH